MKSRKHNAEDRAGKPKGRTFDKIKAEKAESNSPHQFLWTDLPKSETDRAPWFLTHALEAILSAIIDNYPKVYFKLPPNKKGMQDYRLEQSMKFLIGHKIKAGRTSEVDSEQLALLASRYWAACERPEWDETTLWNLAAEIVLPNWRENGVPYEDVDPCTRTLIDAFQKDKEHLLTCAAAEGLEDFEEDHKSKIQEVIALLRELGIIDLRKLTPR